MDRSGLEWAYQPSSVGVTVQIGLLHVAYLALLAAVVLWVFARAARAAWTAEPPWREPRWRREIGWLTALIALAMALRFAAPASPMDLHHRLAPAWYEAQIAAPYGWGMPVLASLLWKVFGRTDGVVFAANALIGSLTLIPLHGVARRLGLTETGRFWACVLLATMPLHIRFSHTDNQSILEIPLLLIALWAWSEWAARPRLSLAVFGALALGVAMCQRPEAIVLPLVPLSWLLLCERPPRWPTSHVGAALGILILVSGLHMLAMAHQLLVDPAGPRTWGWIGPLRGPAHYAFLWPRWVAPTLLGGLAFAVVAPRPARARRIWLAGVALGLASLVFWVSPLSVGLLATRHQLRALPFAALLAGAGLAALVEWIASLRRPVPSQGIRVAVSVVASALLVVPLAAGLEPTTLNAEYRFYVDTLPSVPRCCTIVTWFPPDDRSLQPPTYLSEQAPIRHRWTGFERLAELDPADDECLLYYRPASCFAYGRGEPIRPAQRGRHPLNADCEHWERTQRLRPLWTTELPARSSGTARFGSGRLQVGFFALGPSDRSPAELRCWDQPKAPTTDVPLSHEPVPCGAAFSPEQAEAIHGLVRSLPMGRCSFDSLRTDRERARITWRSQDSQDTAKVHCELAGGSCRRADEAIAAEGGGVVLIASPSAAQQCPTAYEALQKLVQDVVLPAPRAVR